MKVARRSVITGKLRVADLDVTADQIDRWQGGELVQDAMPHLPTSHREFLVSGTTPEEWLEHLGADRKELDMTPIPFTEEASA